MLQINQLRIHHLHNISHLTPQQLINKQFQFSRIYTKALSVKVSLDQQIMCTITCDCWQALLTSW